MVSVQPRNAMTQSTINQAVRECVRECLGTHEPLATLMHCIERMRDEGWSHTDLELIRRTALRMLSVIYDADGKERESQDE